jgi:DNA-directed RNA polymerase beta' subunit
METIDFGTSEMPNAVLKEKSLLLIDESSPVESVMVNVWSDEELVHEAATEVKFVSGSLGVNSMDPKLGATETTPCGTCTLDHPRCPGHWGYINLKDIFLRSSYVHKQLIQMIFSCICIHCHRPYYDFDKDVASSGRSRVPRLTACFKYMKGKEGKGECSTCGKKVYGIIEDDNRNPKLNKFSELEIGISKTESMVMPMGVLRKILLGLTPAQRKTIGIEGVETEDFFFTKLPVMPNNIRPKRNFEGKEEVHQFTVLYEKISKAVEDMETAKLSSSYKTTFDKERELFYHKIYVETLFALEQDQQKRLLLTSEELELVERTDLPNLMERYQLIKRERDEAREEDRFYSWKNKRRIVNLHVREFDNAYGQQTFQVRFTTSGGDKAEKFTPVLKKSEGVNIDMNTMIKSKYGLVREKIMGKRVNFCARTVASPAPFRGRADEVWVPEKFRNTLLMTETVTSDLRDALKKMAENKMILYVVLKDVKHSNIPFRGERTRWNEFLYYLRSNQIRGDPIDYLVDGDEIERQLIEGVNYLLLNRQPSIWRYSLGAFRVRFWDNATIGVPDVALKAFNGDFDGDEFNLWTIRDRNTEAEIIQMFSPVRNVLGNARNSTAYGLHYDPVTGVFLITRVIERKLPLPNVDEDYRKIADFLGSIESQYFEEQNERLSSRRYFRVFLRKEGERNVVVFSSETVVPRDYFIDEVKEHIANMKGRNLTTFHQKLAKHKLFYVPESEQNIRDLGRSYTGRAAFSLLLPEDFYFDNGKVKIEAGVLVKGTVTKSEIGAFSHTTIFHELTRLYGYEVCSQVMDSLVWFTKTYLTRGNTLSFGLEDYGFVGRDAEKETDRIVWVRKLVSEYQSVYQTLKTLAGNYRQELETMNIGISVNNVLRDIRGLRATEEVKGFLAEYCATEDEKSARNLLLAAATLEEKNESLYLEVRAKVEELEKQKKEAESKREFTKVGEIEGKIIELLNGIRSQEAKNIESVVDPENAFLKCEGKRGNIFEVMGSVGLQTVSGKRIHTGSASNRALPSIFPGDTSPEALGMVLGNFTRGLDPSEAAFLSWAARIGPVVTKTQTSVIGDIANRMTNAFQGIVMRDGLPQETVRETANCVQMSYGYDNLDPKFLVVRKGDQQFDDSLPPSARVDYRTDKPGQSVIDVANIQVRLNTLGKSLSQLSTLEEIDMVNQYLQTHIVNQYSMIQVPTDGTVYVVKGASFVTTQKSVSNVRNMLRQAIMNLKFPEGVSRKEVIQETLEDVVSRMTGVRNKVRVIENVQIGQGEKVGRYISGAIQQPIMQAALNSVVWEEKMLIRREHDIAVEPIGQFIDRFLDGELSESIQRYPLNNTEYLDVSQYGYEIQSVDEFGKVSWKLIEALTRHEVPEGGLIHVKTTSGREVTATVGKSFLVRRNNKIVQIEGSELKLGDRLPVTRQAPSSENHPMELTEENGVSTGYSFGDSEEIPTWMYSASNKFLKGFIDGYFRTNGVKEEGHTKAVCGDCLGFSELLQRLGIMSKIDNNTITIIEEGDLTSVIPLRLSSDVSDKEYLKKDLQTMLDNQALNESDRKIVQEALDSDVYFDEIVSITPASTTDNHPKVYDFTIQDTRNFASFGGLHNADTFHSSGTTSSASNVKDRFIRLVTASSAGKRSGTMIMNKTPNNFYDAYRIRNQVREISLATILKDPAPQMNYDVSPMDTVPELVRKLLSIEFPSHAEELMTGSSYISFISFLYDPLMLKSSGLSTMDLKRFLSSISTNDFKIFPVITKDSFYLFTSEKDSTKARNGFQRNVIARLSDHKLNFGYRLSGEGMEEMYPTEFKITDGIKSVYRTSEGYLVQMNRRHMNRFGYSFDKVVKMFEVAGVSGNMIVNPSKAQIVFPGATTSPMKLVEQKMAVEADVMEADWRKSIEVNRRKEPLPGPVTQSAYGYYMKTIGGNMKFMMRNPQVNYRASYNDGILEIEENLGLRAARNFMVHEIEQIFALSGANEIDYRHVVLMIDSMVSQGSISRLTFQGVDKIAGPNPLNQAGVGFAPTSTFAVAALKKKDFSADVGYAVNFLATRPKILREKTFDERVTSETQRDKIKSYLSKLPSLKKSKEKVDVDYQVLKTVRQRERTVIDSVVPVSDLPISSRVDVCERPVIAYSKAFENDLTEYYDGFMNGLDVFGEPTEL